MWIPMHEKNKNNHYFVIFGWGDSKRSNAPKYIKKFDIYDDAVEYFEYLQEICEYVELFENIGGKRKWIADSATTSDI